MGACELKRPMRFGDNACPASPMQARWDENPELKAATAAYITGTEPRQNAPEGIERAPNRGEY